MSSTLTAVDNTANPVTSMLTVKQSTGTTTTSLQQSMNYVYPVVGFIGMVENILVLIIIATSRTLRKRLENSLIFNQSLMDGLSGLFLIFMPTTTLSNMHYSGPWGEFVCRFWVPAMPLWGTLQASVFSLVIMTVERYMEIVHPIYYKVNRNRFTVWIMVLIPWIASALVTFQVIIFKNGVSSDGNCVPGSSWPNTAAMNANGILSLCFKYVLPLPVFIYCYVRMFMALSRSQDLTATTLRKQQATSSSEGSKLTGMERARRNVIKTMLYITIAHILCWSLNQILYAASQIFGVYVDRNGVPYIMSVVIVYLNCWVNPIIYVTCYKAFRQDLIRRRALRGSKVKSSTIVTGTNQSARSDM